MPNPVEDILGPPPSQNIGDKLQRIRFAAESWVPPAPWVGGKVGQQTYAGLVSGASFGYLQPWAGHPERFEEELAHGIGGFVGFAVGLGKLGAATKALGLTGRGVATATGVLGSAELAAAAPGATAEAISAVATAKKALTAAHLWDMTKLGALYGAIQDTGETPFTSADTKARAFNAGKQGAMFYGIGRASGFLHDKAGTWVLNNIFQKAKTDVVAGEVVRKLITDPLIGGGLGVTEETGYQFLSPDDVHKRVQNAIVGAISFPIGSSIHEQFGRPSVAKAQAYRRSIIQDKIQEYAPIREQYDISDLRPEIGNKIKAMDDLAQREQQSGGILREMFPKTYEAKKGEAFSQALGKIYPQVKMDKVPSVTLGNEKPTEVPYESTASPDIKSFADRIVSGEKMEKPEDLQFYDNNKSAIEAELKARQGGATEQQVGKNLSRIDRINDLVKKHGITKMLDENGKEKPVNNFVDLVVGLDPQMQETAIQELINAKSAREFSSILANYAAMKPIMDLHLSGKADDSMQAWVNDNLKYKISVDSMSRKDKADLNTLIRSGNKEAADAYVNDILSQKYPTVKKVYDSTKAVEEGRRSKAKSDAKILKADEKADTDEQLAANRAKARLERILEQPANEARVIAVPNRSRIVKKLASRTGVSEENVANTIKERERKSGLTPAKARQQVDDMNAGIKPEIPEKKKTKARQVRETLEGKRPERVDDSGLDIPANTIPQYEQVRPLIDGRTKMVAISHEDPASLEKMMRTLQPQLSKKGLRWMKNGQLGVYVVYDAKATQAELNERKMKMSSENFVKHVLFEPATDAERKVVDFLSRIEGKRNTVEEIRNTDKRAVEVETESDAEELGNVNYKMTVTEAQLIKDGDIEVSDAEPKNKAILFYAIPLRGETKDISGQSPLEVQGKPKFAAEAGMTLPGPETEGSNPRVYYVTPDWTLAKRMATYDENPDARGEIVFLHGPRLLDTINRENRARRTKAPIAGLTFDRGGIFNSYRLVATAKQGIPSDLFEGVAYNKESHPDKRGAWINTMLGLDKPIQALESRDWRLSPPDFNLERSADTDALIQSLIDSSVRAYGMAQRQGEKPEGLGPTDFKQDFRDRLINNFVVAGTNEMNKTRTVGELAQYTLWGEYQMTYRKAGEQGITEAAVQKGVIPPQQEVDRFVSRFIKKPQAYLDMLKKERPGLLKDNVTLETQLSQAFNTDFKVDKTEFVSKAITEVMPNASKFRSIDDLIKNFDVERDDPSDFFYHMQAFMASNAGHPRDPFKGKVSPDIKETMSYLNLRPGTREAEQAKWLRQKFAQMNKQNPLINDAEFELVRQDSEKLADAVNQMYDIVKEGGAKAAALEPVVLAMGGLKSQMFKFDIPAELEKQRQEAGFYSPEKLQHIIFSKLNKTYSILKWDKFRRNGEREVMHWARLGNTIIGARGKKQYQITKGGGTIAKSAREAEIERLYDVNQSNIAKRDRLVSNMERMISSFDEMMRTDFEGGQRNSPVEVTPEVKRIAEELKQYTLELKSTMDDIDKARNEGNQERLQELTGVRDHYLRTIKDITSEYAQELQALKDIPEQSQYVDRANLQNRAAELSQRVPEKAAEVQRLWDNIAPGQPQPEAIDALLQDPTAKTYVVARKSLDAMKAELISINNPETLKGTFAQVYSQFPVRSTESTVEADKLAEEIAQEFKDQQEAGGNQWAGSVTAAMAKSYGYALTDIKQTPRRTKLYSFPGMFFDPDMYAPFTAGVGKWLKSFNTMFAGTKGVPEEPPKTKQEAIKERQIDVDRRDGKMSTIDEVADANRRAQGVLTLSNFLSNESAKEFADLIGKHLEGPDAEKLYGKGFNLNPAQFWRRIQDSIFTGKYWGVEAERDRINNPLYQKIMFAMEGVRHRDLTKPHEWSPTLKAHDATAKLDGLTRYETLKSLHPDIQRFVISLRARYQSMREDLIAKKILGAKDGGKALREADAEIGYVPSLPYAKETGRPFGNFFGMGDPKQNLRAEHVRKTRSVLDRIKDGNIYEFYNPILQLKHYMADMNSRMASESIFERLRNRFGEDGLPLIMLPNEKNYDQAGQDIDYHKMMNTGKRVSAAVSALKSFGDEVLVHPEIKKLVDDLWTSEPKDFNKFQNFVGRYKAFTKSVTLWQIIDNDYYALTTLVGAMGPIGAIKNIGAITKPNTFADFTMRGRFHEVRQRLAAQGSPTAVYREFIDTIWDNFDVRANVKDKASASMFKRFARTMEDMGRDKFGIDNILFKQLDNTAVVVFDHQAEKLKAMGLSPEEADRVAAEYTKTALGVVNKGTFSRKFGNAARYMLISRNLAFSRIRIATGALGLRGPQKSDELGYFLKRNFGYMGLTDTEFNSLSGLFKQHMLRNAMTFAMSSAIMSYALTKMNSGYGQFPWDRKDPKDWFRIGTGRIGKDGSEIMISNPFLKEFTDQALFAKMPWDILTFQPPEWLLNKTDMTMKAFVEVYTGAKVIPGQGVTQFISKDAPFNDKVSAAFTHLFSQQGPFATFTPGDAAYDDPILNALGFMQFKAGKSQGPPGGVTLPSGQIVSANTLTIKAKEFQRQLKYKQDKYNLEVKQLLNSKHPEDVQRGLAMLNFTRADLSSVADYLINRNNPLGTQLEQLVAKFKKSETGGLSEVERIQILDSLKKGR